MEASNQPVIVLTAVAGLFVPAPVFGSTALRVRAIAEPEYIGSVADV